MGPQICPSYITVKYYTSFFYKFQEKRGNFQMKKTRTAALICEFNPLHTGHEYILSEILAEQQKALELKDWEMHVLNWEEGRLTEIHWIRNGYPSLKGEISFAGLIDLEVLEITWNEELTGIDITQNEKCFSFLLMVYSAA